MLVALALVALVVALVFLAIGLYQSLLATLGVGPAAFLVGGVSLALAVIALALGFSRLRPPRA